MLAFLLGGEEQQVVVIIIMMKFLHVGICVWLMHGTHPELRVTLPLHAFALRRTGLVALIFNYLYMLGTCWLLW